jgi:hypothetical protein
VSKRDFRKKHCRYLKYIDLRTQIYRESIKEGTFSFQFCKRVQDAHVNSMSVVAHLFDFRNSLRAEGNVMFTMKAAESGPGNRCPYPSFSCDPWKERE